MGINYKYLHHFPLHEDVLWELFSPVYEQMIEAHEWKHIVAISSSPCLSELRERFSWLGTECSFLLTGGGLLAEYPIHIDGYGDASPRVSLNYALANCDEYSRTCFYRLLPGNEIIEANGGRQPKDPRLVEKVEEVAFVTSTRRPYLIRADVPHGVVNLSSQSAPPRVMFAWRMYGIEWQRALAEFREYFAEEDLDG